jgi:hypothetical protein
MYMYQAENYRKENEKLKSQLDLYMNSHEEIARLKNLVTEKVKIIGVMEKERSGLPVLLSGLLLTYIMSLLTYITSLLTYIRSLLTYITSLLT